MRASQPFTRDDLRDFQRQLLDRAEAVVAMREIHAGERHPDVIGLRHDVDNMIAPCRELALWEAQHGVRSTYFILHDSPYWGDPELPRILEDVAGHGHEIGIHANAIAVALERGGDPDAILYAAIERLRGWGHRVTGVVAHGDRICHRAQFVNDEQFLECSRPDYGPATRTLSYAGLELRLRPRPLADFGLEYDSIHLDRAMYLSDSGGSWNEEWHAIIARFPNPFGQLHILQHPCWWVRAFPTVAEVAA